MSSIQPVTPPALDFLVGKCLAKDPDERWQSARDVLGQLEWISQGSGSQSGVAAASAPATRPPGRQRLALWTLAVLTVGLAAALGLTLFRGEAAAGARCAL